MEMKKLLRACNEWKMMVAKWEEEDNAKDQTAVADHENLYLDDDWRQKPEPLNQCVPRRQKPEPLNHCVPRKQRSQEVIGRSNINDCVFQSQEISRKAKKRDTNEAVKGHDTDHRPKKVVAAKKRCVVPSVLLPRAPLPQYMRDYIYNKMNLMAPPLFFANKLLKNTDLNPGQSRLSIPEQRVDDEFINNFLTDAERTDLEDKNDIAISFVDERLQEYHNLYLRRWSLTSTSLYVFKSGWNSMVSKNRFRADIDIAQVWAFRVEQRLWFALFTTPMA